MPHFKPGRIYVAF